MRTDAAHGGGGPRWLPWLLVGGGLALFAVHGPWDLAPAAWISVVLLVRAARCGPARVALGAVWLVEIAAAVFFLTTTAIGLAPLQLLSAVALGTVFTVPFVVDRLVIHRLRGARGGPVGALLAFPAARVACEFAVFRWSPVGAVYGSLGLTQHAALPLMQLSALTGVYGVSFLIAWFATVANHLWERGLAWARVRAAVAVYGATLLVVLLTGSARLAVSAHEGPGPTVRVAGISPSPAARSTEAEMLGALQGHRGIAQGDPRVVRPALAVIDNELLASTRRFEERGISCHLGLVPLDDSAEARIVELLRREPYECVVIGGGIRKAEELLELFEVVVNLVRRHAPQAAIAFNTSPDDCADAAQRWITSA